MVSKSLIGGTTLLRPICAETAPPNADESTDYTGSRELSGGLRAFSIAGLRLHWSIWQRPERF